MCSSDLCDAADTKPILLGATGPTSQYEDTLAIENPHDVDWFRFNVPGGAPARLVRFRTAARPFAATDTSDIDFYVLNVPGPTDTLMTGTGFAKAGSTVDDTLTLAPGDYYAVVVDFAGIPTRYSMCIGVIALLPPNPNCSTLLAAPVAAPSAAQAQSSVTRRARLEAVIQKRGLRTVLLRPRGSLK